jgi:hypothetical protein
MARGAPVERPSRGRATSREQTMAGRAP